MTYRPTQAGFMQLQDSARLLRVVFPNYPELQPLQSDTGSRGS